ncbi:MAG: transcription antitermination factor NusB [Candidatus Obscuribacterales bacterium]|nr:transcription antitermination factor NusB [Candidatus Obscuribacterales bacterium]
MSARRIARELAVIIMPQLPKDKSRLERMEFDSLLAKSVHILTEHARQCLSEANGYLIKAQQELHEIELHHPDNSRKLSDLKGVTLTTTQVKEQVELLELALHLVSEALDIPDMALASDQSIERVTCKDCGKTAKVPLRKPNTGEIKAFVEALLSSFLDNRKMIDDIIGSIKTKWRMERMVSIDRDILRLACAEAFFMPDIPVNVAISEAVELAHRFADDKAARFINGVLAELTEDAQHYRTTGELKLTFTEENEDTESGKDRKAPVRR